MTRPPCKDLQLLLQKYQQKVPPSITEYSFVTFAPGSLFPLLEDHMSCVLPKNCIMQLPDVPLSLASKCRLVVRRTLSDTRPLTIAKLGKEEGGNHYFQVLARDSKTSSTSCPGTRPSLTHPTPLSRSHTEPWLLPARKHLQL